MQKTASKSRLSLSLSSNQQKIILSLATASLLFTGCGGGSSGTTPDAPSTEKSAYLIDSAVEGIDYTCGTLTGTTNSEGKFTYDATKCPSGVEFKLGSLSLGTINPSTINPDTYLTIQELAGTTRDNVAHPTVQKLAVFLQSLDEDNNASNGIVITQNIKNAITLDGNISDKTEIQIHTEITKPSINKNLIDITSALTHLVEFTKTKEPTIQSAFKRGNTVIDIDTKLSSYKWLQWQDNNESNTTTVKNQDFDIKGAENYCSALTLDGFDDWRAPNVEELLRIVDSTKTGAKIKSAFEYTSASQYATVESDYDGGMYFIDFLNGSQGVNHWNETSYDDDYKIRCVRDILSGIDLIPDQFTFNDNLTASELNTAYESNSVTISGLTPLTKSKVTITGGEYKIDNGAWTNTTGEISNGQTIKVRGTTPTTIGIRQNATLTIGGISDTFAVAKPLPKTGNIVTDPTINLMWQDNSAVTSNAQNWSSAVAYCDNLTLDSYGDWRLPTAIELKNIVDKNNQPTNKTGFQYGSMSYYWTSDEHIGFSLPSRQVIRFLDGYESWYPSEPNSFDVRCVRGGN